jgi:hypothetical protein
MNFETNSVVIVPAKVFMFYGFGVLFPITAAFLLWIMSENKKSKWLATISVLISILLMADGSGHYVGVTTDGISFKRGIAKANQHYTWSNIQHVVYREFPEEGGFSKFDFYFKDGEMVTLPENWQMRIFTNSLTKVLRREEIELTRK